MYFHSLNIEKVLDSLDTDLFGLKNEEVEKEADDGLKKQPRKNNEHLRKFLGFAQIELLEFIIILILSSSILI